MENRMNLVNRRIAHAFGRAPLATLVLMLLWATESVGQVAYVDAQGREWRQMANTTGLTWNQVDAVCPNDGVTPCAGMLGGVNATGWIWATQTQVMELFSETVPEIAQTSSVGGPGYVLQGLSFFGPFKPTFEYYTTFGGYNYISGWTSTSNGADAIIPEVSAQYPVFYGSFNVVAQTAITSTSSFRGVWMFKPAPGPFQNLGGSLPGTYGAPGLKGSGTLSAGSATTLTIAHGNPNGLAALVIGTQVWNAPFLGGTFVPTPDLVLAGLPLDANGGIALTAPWPANVPSGVQLVFQAWMPDTAAPFGASATNALLVSTP